jgi:transcriptional regulator GlxA family with amidase domain
VSPSRFVQRIRVEKAVSLLGSTALSVEEISARVGYADASTLRRILRRETGKAPSQWRSSPAAGLPRKAATSRELGVSSPLPETRIQ